MQRLIAKLLYEPGVKEPLTEPDYKRPFEQGDFRGYFKWTRKLTAQLGGVLYHACHDDGLRSILKNNELGLRSKWSLRLPKHGEWSAPGTWVGLNYFSKGNYYGPFVLEFPLRALNDRHFMVFRRQGNDRHRHFFVQYEARIPVYSFGKQLWRNINPATYFQDVNGDDLEMKPGAIYDIVITQPLSLKGVSIKAVNHPWCVAQICNNGISLRRSRRELADIAKDEFYDWLSESEEYRKLFSRFNILNRQHIELFDPDDDT